LGQSRDFTSVAIVERVEETGAWDAAAFAYRKTTALRLRYLERMPLGTTYVEVAARVRELVRSGELHGRCELAVDATGVGAGWGEGIEADFSVLIRNRHFGA